MSKLTPEQTEMLYQIQGCADAGEGYYHDSAVDSLILSLTAQCAAYRDALTMLWNLHHRPPPMDSQVALASRAWTAAERIIGVHGCADCHDKTLEDGMICCWTCGREMPEAPISPAAPPLK